MGILHIILFCNGTITIGVLNTVVYSSIRNKQISRKSHYILVLTVEQLIEGGDRLDDITTNTNNT